MEIRCTLDGTVVNEPSAFNDLEIALSRNHELRGLFEEFTSDIIFTGEGYDYLANILKERTFTKKVNCLLERIDGNTVTTIIDGVIFSSDLSHNITKKTITTNVLNTPFFDLIDRNKNQTFSSKEGKSKTGLAITNPPIYNLDMFNPDGGAYSKPTRPFWKVSDVMKFLVAAMTDGEVGFQSDYLTTPANWTSTYIAGGDTFDNPLPYISVGKNIRSGFKEKYPEVSFADIDREINKAANTAMALEKESNGNWQIRYENTEYFFESSNVLEIKYIHDH